MSLETPETVQEWAGYIARLSGLQLWSKAIAANTLEFVRTIQAEGFEGSEITDVLVLFALQLQADGQALPTDMPGQYLSYPDLVSSMGR